MAAAFIGNTTKAEARERLRKENQDELGVCRIRRIAEDQRSPQTLGSGFVVKDLQIFPGFAFPYCLISSDKVFPKDDCNIESYFLDFKKLGSTDLKTVELKHVAAKSTDFTRTSGLVLIRIDPSGKCKKDQSIFTYRPFKVANDGIAPGEDLKCCFVDDHSGQRNFSLIGLALKRPETVSTQYELHEFNERPYTKYDDIIARGGHRKPFGAVILKLCNKEFMAVGALTFTDECRKISSAFFPLHVPFVTCTQTSQPSDGSRQTGSDGEQHVSVDNAPSAEDESPGVASTALDVRIDVDTMEHAENTTQDRTASAVESEGSQGGKHQAASAVPVSSGQTQASCAGDEAHQTPNPILTKEDVLSLIAANYLQNSPPKCKADRDDFMAYMKQMRLIITGVRIGSLLITVKCDSLQTLEGLWEDYSCGRLGEVVQRCFVTEEILTELSLAVLKLKTTISEEEYKACKKYLSEDPGREADETDDDDDSASEDEALTVNGQENRVTHKSTHSTEGLHI